MSPKSMKKWICLCNESINEEGIGNCTPGVTPDESHQEAESNEHHDIDVLESRISLRSDSISSIEFVPDEDPHEDNKYDLKYEKKNPKTPQRVLFLIKVSIDIGLSSESFFNSLLSWPFLFNHFYNSKLLSYKLF